MAAQVDALAQCPPETFRSSDQNALSVGMTRRTPSLLLPDSGLHTWTHTAPRRPVASTHASKKNGPFAAAGAQNGDTPAPPLDPALLSPSAHSPSTAAAAAASVSPTGQSGSDVSADMPSVRTHLIPSPNRTLPLATESCLDVALSPSQPSRPRLKRRRASSDVDGPDTGARSRKKRRLRRFLITSRLSQPFSLPASHILNRESLASGDKRFLKMAAIMNGRRIVSLLTPPPSSAASASQSPPGLPTAPTAASAVPHTPHNPSDLLHRAAMANRLRKRLFTEVAATGRPISTRNVPAQLMASARFSAVLPGGTAGRATTVSSAAANASLLKVPPVFRSAVLRPLAHPAVARAGIVPAPPAMAMRISPRLRPVQDGSPVPHLCLHKENEGRKDDGDSNTDDDDGDSERYDYGASDDPEDVYADFSVLFSGGSDDEWDEEGIDDIMDELDGIAHLPR